MLKLAFLARSVLFSILDLHHKDLTTVLNFQNFTPYRRELDNGFVLTSIASPEDIERLVEFNGTSFGPGEATMTRALITHHPSSRPDYWLILKDQDRIIASVVLIPWAWRYEETVLKCGEMGIVSTAAAYRNRGLMRVLDARFKELLHKDGFHLSPIQGIPYFYRQFDYEYALPMEAQWRIELWQIPAPADAAITFRKATVEDIPMLQQLHAVASQRQNISTIRSAEIWRYLLEHSPGTGTEADTWLLERNQQIVAYCRIHKEGFGEGLIVSEASRLDHQTSDSLLAWLKSVAIERGKPYIRFNLPVMSDLLTLARAYGAVDGGGYQWQIHVVDPARLLRQIGPVLERRLVGSPFATLTQSVVINLYRNAVALSFEQGQLRSVEALNRPTDSPINLPPNLLAPLVLGFRSRSELAEDYPDARIYGSACALIDTLFPPMQAFLDTIY